MKKTLAIDYGLERVGLAVSRGTLADPLKTIHNGDTLLDDLVQIIEEEEIEEVVVGLSQLEMAEMTRKFAQDLEQVTSAPIFFTDENYSSKVVEDRIRNKEIKVRQGEPIDHLAAAVFLQEWLDENG